MDYKIPYARLAQWAKTDGDGNPLAATVVWNPARLVVVEFGIQAGPAFDVWVDDLHFY